MNNTMKMLINKNETLKKLTNNSLFKGKYEVSLDLLEAYKDNIKDFHDVHVRQRLIHQLGQAIYDNEKTKITVKELTNDVTYDAECYIFSPDEFNSLIDELIKEMFTYSTDERLFELRSKLNENS